MRHLRFLVPLSLMAWGCAGTPAARARPPRAALELAAPAPPTAERDSVALVTPRLGPPGGRTGAGQRHVQR